MHEEEFDRFYWPLAMAVFGSYLLKLSPHLNWQETAQNAALFCGITAMAVLSMAYPATYRRHGRLLRVLLQIYSYCMPVLTSMPAFNAFTPAPSKIRPLAKLIDTYSLWLSTRNALLSWAVLGCRPPLWLAVPLQLFGLLRITRADFCQSPVLSHPVMEERTQSAHLYLSIFLLGLGGVLPWSHVIPTSHTQRCRSLLLFYNLVFAVLLPLMLLVPLRHQAAEAGNARESSNSADSSNVSSSTEQQRGPFQRAEHLIESWLRLLMWPRPAVPRGHQQQQQQQQQPGQQQEQVRAQSTQAILTTLLLRWWVALTVMWLGCCILEG